MDYLTNYYKNLAEDLSRRLNHLKILVEASKLEDDEMVDPETGMPLMPLPSKFARSPYTPTESDKLVSNAFSVPGSFQAPTPLSIRPQLGRVDFSSKLPPKTLEQDIKTNFQSELEARDEIEKNVLMQDGPQWQDKNPDGNPGNLNYQTYVRKQAIDNQIAREREARNPEAAKQKIAASNEMDLAYNLHIPTGMGGIKGELYDLLDKAFPMYNKILNMKLEKAYKKIKKNPTHPWYDPTTTKQ